MRNTRHNREMNAQFNIICNRRRRLSRVSEAKATEAFKVEYNSLESQSHRHFHQKQLNRLTRQERKETIAATRAYDAKISRAIVTKSKSIAKPPIMYKVSIPDKKLETT